jgi:hypothetical protein
MRPLHRAKENGEIFAINESNQRSLTFGDKIEFTLIAEHNKAKHRAYNKQRLPNGSLCCYLSDAMIIFSLGILGVI